MSNDELDRLIAEKVMKWHLQPDEENPDLQEWADENGESQCPREFWGPSRYIGEAWKMAKIMLQTHTIQINGNGREWTVSFCQEGRPVSAANHEILSMAFCMAALKAVEE